ncbi:hexose carrier protein HEX6-like [Hordeum vulgare subsp. vulgare]|uniref:Major facilitator superfamily (MFS) profile domain-containing protein n=2 Tax=Hordeum vulgare subsp. vulgare TaxID=112509 RepID=A0A8I6W8L5_HORVV|nr:hexose carrier protein HEX6-like [Hordeum vulgare subsp. vulgare]
MDGAGGGREYGGRVTAFVALSCITASMGGVIYGYDIGVAGGVSSMEPFLGEFFPDVYRRMKGDSRVSNYCKFDSQLLTLFTSSLYISGLLTAVLLSSWVTASCGRRPSMIVGGTAYLAGAAVSGGAVNVYMAILGRALLGVGLGFANQAVPLYLSEMAPTRYRGAFSNGFQFSLCLGDLAATVTNYGVEKIKAGWGWRLSLAFAGIPAVFLTVGSIFLPETPNILVRQGKDRLVVRALLHKLRGFQAVDQELDDIIAANILAAKPGDNGMHMILSQRQYRPQLAMAILIPSFVQLTGISAIGFYAPVLLRSIGVGESASLISTIILVLVSSVSTFISMFTVDRVGRRTLLLIGGIQMILCEVLIGAIMAIKLGDDGGINKTYAIILIFLMGVYVVGFGLSWGPLGWLVPSEIFPLEIRSAGQSITVALCFAMTICISQFFLTMLCQMKAYLFFFFAGWIVVMTAFVYFFLPETKGLPIEQIGKVWGKHWFWKKVVGVGEVAVGY